MKNYLFFIGAPTPLEYLSIDFGSRLNRLSKIAMHFIIFSSVLVSEANLLNTSPLVYGIPFGCIMLLSSKYNAIEL